MSSENIDADHTLVLLTPVALTAATWDAVALPGKVFRFEYPGHGSRPARGTDWTLDALADEVVSLVGGPLDIVGISMGSMLAQHILVRHPDRVRSALLMAAGAASDAGVAAGRAQRILDVGARAVTEETIQRWFSPAALADPMNRAVAQTRLTLETADAASIASAWRAMSRHDVRDALSSVQVPVTCVAASEDKATPVGVVEQLANAIPSAILTIVPGAHMMHLETPARFAAELNRHLDRVGAIT